MREAVDDRRLPSTATSRRSTTVYNSGHTQHTHALPTLASSPATCLDISVFASGITCSGTMSDDPFNVPPVPEQDEAGGDGLPTYDDLAAQHGPNSRYALVGYPSDEPC